MTALPTIGLGTAAFALCPEKDALATLHHALERGITYFDTASLYGGGQAEARLGRALSGAGPEVAVSTKLGRERDWGAAPAWATGQPDRWDFSESATRRSVARSCARLGRDFLDVVFLHDIHMAPEQALAEALPVLRELQADGVIGMIGAACNTVAEHLTALKGKADDILLVAGRWTLLDRSAGTQLLPACLANDTRVVAGAVLNSGLLAGPPFAGRSFDYRPATEVEVAEAERLDAEAKKAGIDLVTAALQFPRRHRTVNTLLLGAASATEIDKSLAALKRQVPDAFWARVHGMGIGTR